mmetsp:Transcript_66023/g.166437  ORF Transcript_66023/g.166437 Transcript_66023/m.166437 type:complete len:421 (+) Transcript_66023:910-2172(+)
MRFAGRCLSRCRGRCWGSWRRSRRRSRRQSWSQSWSRRWLQRGCRCRRRCRRGLRSRCQGRTWSRRRSRRRSRQGGWGGCGYLRKPGDPGDPGDPRHSRHAPSQHPHLGSPCLLLFVLHHGASTHLRLADNVIPSPLVQVIQAGVRISADLRKQPLVEGLGSLPDPVARDCKARSLGVVHDVVLWPGKLQEAVPEHEHGLAHGRLFHATLVRDEAPQPRHVLVGAPVVAGIARQTVRRTHGGGRCLLRYRLPVRDLVARAQSVVKRGQVHLGGHQKERLWIRGPDPLRVHQVVLKSGAAKHVAAALVLPLIPERGLACLREDGPICKLVVVVHDVAQVGVTLAPHVLQPHRLGMARAAALAVHSPRPRELVAPGNILAVLRENDLQLVLGDVTPQDPAELLHRGVCRGPSCGSHSCSCDE